MNKARQWGFMQRFMLGIAAYIVAEVIVIMLVSRWIGGAGVVLLMAGTAVLGGVLARTRGRKAWEEMRLRMGRESRRAMRCSTDCASLEAACSLCCRASSGTSSG